MPRAAKPFRERVEASVVVVDGCWVWTFTRDRHGYGRTRVCGKSVFAHRASYEAFVGAIPTGLVIDHLCRNRACVNPAHLEAVTAQINQLRGVSVSGLNARKTHCPKGHALSGENLAITRRPQGPYRSCKTCHRDRERVRRERLTSLNQGAI